MTKNCSQIC